jgi:hypothetical protein
MISGCAAPGNSHNAFGDANATIVPALSRPRSVINNPMAGRYDGHVILHHDDGTSGFGMELVSPLNVLFNELRSGLPFNPHSAERLARRAL